VQFCPNCGQKLEIAWQVCPNCGSPSTKIADNNQIGSLQNPQVIRTQQESLDRVDRDKTTSRANVLSISSMWLSIAGLVLLLFGGVGVVLSVAGVICGHVAQQSVRGAQGSESSYAKVGLIVGYIGIVIFVLLALLFVQVIALFSNFNS
jgi:hypothetical protein